MKKRSQWSESELQIVIRALESGKYQTIEEACAAGAREARGPDAATSRRNVCQQLSKGDRGPPSDYFLAKRCNVFEKPGEEKLPSTYYRQAIPEQPAAEKQKVPIAKPVDHAEIVAAIRKGPSDINALADALDCSPRRVRERIAAALVAGYRIETDNSRAHVPTPEPRAEVQSTKIAPVLGGPQSVGVISDLHAGSKYCLREQIKDCVDWMYNARGIREILVPGDLLQGLDKKWQWELSHFSIEDQITDLYDTLPQLPGLRYLVITGNHDEKFWLDSGLDVGLAIERNFAVPEGDRKPRHDLKCYGARGAMIEHRGVKFHLWHPLKGKSYAKSYPLQKLVEMYQSGEKPDVLLAGHWHMFVYLVSRGVHMLACPAFQGGGGAFGKALGGAPELGGIVLTWEATEHTIRNLTVERRSYFEVECAHKTELDVGAHCGLPS